MLVAINWQKIWQSQQDITQYYVVLGLTCGETIEQIKQARNLLAREWHPGRFPSDGEKVQAEEKMKCINLAYAFLGSAIL